MMQAQLGLIPSWQFSSDPGVNIKLNPHVQFPPGWTQRTVQPVGPAYAAARIAQPDLGYPAAHTLGGVFDSWAFEHRKALVLGGLGLLAAAVVGVSAAFLK